MLQQTIKYKDKLCLMTLRRKKNLTILFSKNHILRKIRFLMKDIQSTLTCKAIIVRKMIILLRIYVNKMLKIQVILTRKQRRVAN